MHETSLMLTRRSESAVPPNIAELAQRYRRVAPALEQLGGPGSAEVRAAARRLTVALELYEQHQRRQAAETLRQETSG
jgi:hypothetical protein